MRFLLTLPFLFAASPILAVEPAPAAVEEREMSDEEKEAAYAEYVGKELKDLHYQTGSAELPDGLARLELPTGYRFLNAADARKVVVDLWGNPPDQGSGLLGMVIPAGEDLAKPDSWAIVVSFSGDGYVSDEDADEIDYSDLLTQMKKGSEQDNKARKAQGFDAMDLVGWAVAPRYDKQGKVLYWAKQLHVENQPVDTLNYDVRVLGRRGVLSLNGVAAMNRVSEVEAASPALVSMVRFNDGHRYADYNSATDKKAEYSLAGLVLGGAVAAKLGLFGKIGAVLLGLKKFLILGVIGIVALFKKIVGRKSQA